MLNDIREYLLRQGVKNVDEALTLLGPALSTLGGQFQQNLRRAGQAMGRIAETPREAVERGVAGVFRPPAKPAVSAGSSATYRLGSSGAQPVAAAAARPVVQASRRPAPAVMGVFDAPAQPAMRAARPAATAAPSAPVVRPSAPAAAPAAPDFVPLDGRQLDMFSGFNRLTNPKGAVTAEGFKIGGTTFNPSDIMPEGVYTQRIRELARSKGVPEELFIEQMTRPGASLAEVADMASIPQGTGFFSGPVEFGSYQLRNLLANKMMNLGDLVKANPKLAIALGGGAGLTAGGLAALSMSGGSDPSAPVAPTQNPLGPTTESVDAGGLINDPEAAQTRAENTARDLAAQLDPSIAAQLPAPTYTGAGGQTNIVTRGENEALVAAKQQYASPKSGLANWYRQREEFSKYPQHTEEIVAELTKRGVLDTPELQAWARSNAPLAYELLKKATGSNLLPSQQTPQLKQQVMTSPAGSNPQNNAIGFAEADAQFSVSGSPTAADLREFARPQVNEQIVPTDPAILYALTGQVLR